MAVAPLIVPDIPADVEGWVTRLSAELESSQTELQLYSDYYEGEHRLVYASAKWRKEFATLFQTFHDNWCQLVIDAVDERLDVEGFRIDEDTEGDEDAWELWQRNGLDAASQIAHTESLIYGRSFVSVWPDDETQGQPRVTVESPSQMIVALSRSDPRRRLAAWKRWVDDSGYLFATLYLEDGLYKFRSRDKAEAATLQIAVPTVSTKSWERREVAGEPWPLPNPLEKVPVVPLYNRPRLALSGTSPLRSASEIKNVIPLQDAVNKVLMDMLISSDFAGFRQRWMTGADIPVDPDTHEPIEAFTAAVNRIWNVPAPDAKFGEFEPTELSNYVGAVELIVQHIASQTRTPPHYFYLTGQFPSGEALKSAEAGLVAKAKRKMRHLGEAWEEVVRLCFAILDDPRAEIMDSETIWADPETRSEGMTADAAMKLATIGVPWRALMEYVGFTPKQIERMESERTAPPPPPAPAVPGDTGDGGMAGSMMGDMGEQETG